MTDTHKPERDPHSGVETTGHEWDGIKELNNPAPRWWLWVFYACCIWSFGYWVVYPAWPTLSGNTKGKWEWTEYKELKASQDEITAIQADKVKELMSMDITEVKNHPELQAFAVAGGASKFKENCAVCHGTGGAGGKGYPNLNDDDWLWGGSLTDIYTTIQHGIRAVGDDATRTSEMPPFGTGEMLSKDEIEKVANFVLSLSGEYKGDVAEGSTIFQNNCASCHGADGKGGRDFGAPNLSDKIWLYGGDHESVVNSIYAPHKGLMPAWSKRLDDATMRQLAIYVHSLGGGEPEKDATTAPAATTAEAAPAAEAQPAPAATEAAPAVETPAAQN